MRIITKQALYARMHEIFTQTEQSGEEIVVTEENQSVFRILPIHSKAPAKRTVDEIFAKWQGKVVFYEDRIHQQLMNGVRCNGHRVQASNTCSHVRSLSNPI